LCPDFLIETYLDHQGESFCLKYDANSLIYISKAMDLFDMSIESLEEIEEGRRLRAAGRLSSEQSGILCETTLPPTKPKKDKNTPAHISSLPSSLAPHFDSLTKGLVNLSKIPTLVIGVQSDALFPFVQQRELAEALRQNGNKEVVYYELDSPMGHDSFLLDVANVTAALKGFL
jgi:homoserine acetyltransferase